MLKALEAVGVHFEIENLNSFRKLREPCVFVSNHMSTLETFILTPIIEPYREITYVIKESLVKYPIFKHIMLNQNPVIVTRKNPKEDLRIVLKEGQDRLKKNISVVVFPQTTRSVSFNPAEFNSIGVKLAVRAEVPVIPVALKTDAWGNSRRFIKDFGPIDPSKPVHIRFGEPIRIEGNGRAEHEQIVGFIQASLEEWERADLPVSSCT